MQGRDFCRRTDMTESYIRNAQMTAMISEGR